MTFTAKVVQVLTHLVDAPHRVFCMPGTGLPLPMACGWAGILLDSLAAMLIC